MPNPNQVDINFNVYSDTPEGKDPDSFSPTLRKYHKILWSKPLPNNQDFYLDLDFPKTGMEIIKITKNANIFFISNQKSLEFALYLA